MSSPNDTPESNADTKVTDRSQLQPATRKLFFIAGSILWIVALVALYQVYRQRVQTSEPPKDTVQPVIVLGQDENEKTPASADELEQDAEEETPAKKKETSSGWDPSGIEDFALTERSGRTVTKADLLGRDWIVGFIFTRCAGPCPKVSQQMYELQDKLKETDVRLVTITVDPNYDTPEVLTKYAAIYSADPERWLFLTGDQQKIYQMIGRSFKMPVKELQGEERKPGFEILHTTNLLHVNTEGVVIGKYNAVKDAEMAKLRRILKEQ